MSSLKDLQKLIVTFCEEREWAQFHNPKDLALSLTLEAAEVLEHFQWKNEDEIKDYVKTHKNEIGDEIADVLYWVLLTGHYLDIDIAAALKNKMKENEKKYPAEKAKGKHTKYTEL